MWKLAAILNTFQLTESHRSVKFEDLYHVSNGARALYIAYTLQAFSFNYTALKCVHMCVCVWHFKLQLWFYNPYDPSPEPRAPPRHVSGSPLIILRARVCVCVWTYCVICVQFLLWHLNMEPTEGKPPGIPSSTCSVSPYTVNTTTHV